MSTLQSRCSQPSRTSLETGPAACDGIWALDHRRLVFDMMSAGGRIGDDARRDESDPGYEH